MTRWQRFYLWIGGARPEDWRGIRWSWSLRSPFPIDWPSATADLLKRVGFLARDPNAGYRQGYYYYFRWQWRFWRGPYYDCFKREGLVCRPILGWPPLEWRKP